MLLLAACSTPAPAVTSAETGGAAVQPYTDISPEELNTMLADKDFLLVNTHIPFEGDLPETDLSIPYNEIGENLRLLPADKDAKIVLYCRSDRMSRSAAARIEQAGLYQPVQPGWRLHRLAEGRVSHGASPHAIKKRMDNSTRLKDWRIN